MNQESDWDADPSFDTTADTRSASIKTNDAETALFGTTTDDVEGEGIGHSSAEDEEQSLKMDVDDPNDDLQSDHRNRVAWENVIKHFNNVTRTYFDEVSESFERARTRADRVDSRCLQLKEDVRRSGTKLDPVKERCEKLVPPLGSNQDPLTTLKDLLVELVAALELVQLTHLVEMAARGEGPDSVAEPSWAQVLLRQDWSIVVKAQTDEAWSDLCCTVKPSHLPNIVVSSRGLGPIVEDGTTGIVDPALAGHTLLTKAFTAEGTFFASLVRSLKALQDEVFRTATETDDKLRFFASRWGSPDCDPLKEEGLTLDSNAPLRSGRVPV